MPGNFITNLPPVGLVVADGVMMKTRYICLHVDILTKENDVNATTTVRNHYYDAEHLAAPNMPSFVSALAMLIS